MAFKGLRRTLLVAIALAVFVLGQMAIAEISDEHMHPKFKSPAARVNPRTGQILATENYEHWINDGQETLNSKLNQFKIVEAEAKNIVFFLGDGMSVATVTAARILKGQLEELEHGGEEGQLYFNTFPNIGVSRTFCTDKQVADSACSATAYLCGTKASDGTIGIKPNVSLGQDCRLHMDTANQVSSVLQWAQKAGKSTGVVTTTRITHASPAGNYAHTAHRDWESDYVMGNHGQDTNACDDIAEQLILREPGINIDVILGGGRREFIPSTINDTEQTNTPGRRRDGKNLIETWKANNNNTQSKYITYRNELLGLDTNNVNKVLGLFSYDHVGYADEQDANLDPTLEQMTEVAIKILSKNPKGFYLFVEGGRIDHAHHESWAKRSLIETIEFDKAIKKADDLTSDDDTLILVTSDHSHTMTINGYPDRGNPLMGIAQNADDGLPYSTLSYANGPGYQSDIYNGTHSIRYNITEDPFEDVTYRQISTAYRESETHGGDDVLIFSKGPFSHLLTGVVQQSYIPHVLGYAARIGDGAKFVADDNNSATSFNLLHFSNYICLIVFSYWLVL